MFSRERRWEKGGWKVGEKGRGWERVPPVHPLIVGYNCETSLECGIILYYTLL
jgi:hypothetical protein